jgi:hypothetical protein
VVFRFIRSGCGCSFHYDCFADEIWDGRQHCRHNQQYFAPA